MGNPRATDDRGPRRGRDETLAKALAPEEIRRGDYVALLHEVHELPTFLWCADAAVLPPDELVRIRTVPSNEAEPLKVEAVCLPFLLAKRPRRGVASFDVRRWRFARLDRAYAELAWHAYTRRRKNRKRR